MLIERLTGILTITGIFPPISQIKIVINFTLFAAKINLINDKSI